MDNLQSSGLELHRGITIGVSQADGWAVTADNSRFPLQQMSDFYRVWLLLEQDFASAKAALDAVAATANVSMPFPMWMLIGSALKAKSAQWADRAMAWVPFLHATEKAHLRSLLFDTGNSKWANQKSRQLARKYVRQIDRVTASSES